jgi:hypothetical protein
MCGLVACAREVKKLRYCDRLPFLLYWFAGSLVAPLYPLLSPAASGCVRAVRVIPCNFAFHSLRLVLVLVATRGTARLERSAYER